jgi:quinol monooxygenase YgiN
VIVVAGTVSIRPERREEAVAVAREMARATRAEPGCISYRFYADLEDPTTFFVFEEWESEAALGRHFETEHMRVFQSRLPGLLAGAMGIKRYVVGSASAM